MADKVIVSKLKLQTLGDAIRSKTGTTASLTLDAMANEINSIETGTSSVNVIKTLLDGRKKANYLFQSYTGTSVDNIISYSDTENVTEMSNMFYQCTNLQTIPQLDTSKVTIMGSMFKECSSLQTIDITSMDKITSTSYSNSMCYSCYRLTKLIIRTMTRVSSLNSNTFKNCYHFDGTVDATYNPDGLKDGRIYVPDNMVDSLKSATNWSAYADIIVPLSTLQEE